MSWETLYAVVLVVIARLSISDGQCYDGWVKFESSCYGFGEDDVTWAGAVATCALYDATLAEIESAEENTFLEGLAINKSYRSLWLGGTDIFSEGHWEWAGSKTPMDDGFEDWYPGEPNHQGGASNEDCLQLFVAENMQWNDEDCNLKTRFVCEISGVGEEPVIGR